MKIVQSITIEDQLVKLLKTIGNVEIYQLANCDSVIYFVQDGKVIDKLIASDYKLLFTEM